MKFWRHINESLRRTLDRADRAVMKLVCQADEGIVGFVERVERACGRVFRIIRRDERKAARKVVETERAVAGSAGRAGGSAVRAGRTLAKQVTSDIAAAGLAVFGAPGRLGRATEALVVYWVLGVWHFGERVGRWVSAPIRNRVVGRAKRQALESITMTPDHKSHWELLALLLAGIVLIIGAVVLFGSDLKAEQSGWTRLEFLSGLPGWAWGHALTLSPLKLAVAVAGLAAGIAAITFWLRMLRDSYRRDYPTAVEQTQWRLVTTLLFIPGAVLYFFKQYNRLPFRKFAAQHVISLMVCSATILVATSTYGTLWYFNQQAQADVDGSGYQAPGIDLDADERRQILSRDRYGKPLKPATSSRRDPFAPIPGEETEAAPSPSPSPSATPGS